MKVIRGRLEPSYFKKQTHSPIHLMFELAKRLKDRRRDIFQIPPLTRPLGNVAHHLSESHFSIFWSFVLLRRSYHFAAKLFKTPLFSAKQWIKAMEETENSNHVMQKYTVFHRFRQAKFVYGGSILSSSPVLLMF